MSTIVIRRLRFYCRPVGDYESRQRQALKWARSRSGRGLIERYAQRCVVRAMSF